MKRNGTRIWGLICFAFLFLSACGSNEAEPTFPAVAENTASIQESPSAATTPSPTPSLPPTFTPLPTSADLPTETPTVLYTPTPTSTPSPTTSPLELTQAAELALTPSPTMIPSPTPATPSQPGYLTPIGQFGGYTSAIAVQGHLAFLGVGPRLLVLDISNPSQPQTVGQSGILPTIIQALSIHDGNVFIITRDDFLHILNISDNGSLQEISSYKPESVNGHRSDYWDLEIVEHMVYVLHGGDTSLLSVIDITNPMLPVEVAVHELSGDVTDISVTGNYLYATSNRDGLHIIDITDPTTPIDAGHFPGQFSSIAIQGTVAYLAAGEAGMHVLDISDPPNPVPIGVYQTDSMPVSKVFLEGNLAYLIDRYDTQGTRYVFYQYGPPSLSGTVLVVDVTNPTQPTEISSFTTPVEIWSMTVKENIAFLATGSLRIFDLTSPDTPVEVGLYEIPGEVWDVVVRGNLAYLAGGVDGLYVVDVTAPSAPAFVSASNTFSGHALRIVYRDDRLYLTNNFQVAFFNDPDDPFLGIRIFDASDPTNPIESGVLRLDNSLWLSDLTAVSTTLYSIQNGTLHVTDTSDPANPVEINDIGLSGFVNNMAIDGNYVFLTSHSDLLHVLDITDPENPREISAGFEGHETLLSQYEPYMSLSMSEIVVMNGFAFVECTATVGDGKSSDLCVLDVRNPMSPKFVSLYKINSTFRDLVAANGYIFVATRGGLLVLDPSDPAAVGLADSIHLSNPQGLEIVGSYIYVANGAGGLVILQIPAN